MLSLGLLLGFLVENACLAEDRGDFLKTSACVVWLHRVISVNLGFREFSKSPGVGDI